jgi:hypothetical protein
MSTLYRMRNELIAPGGQLCNKRGGNIVFKTLDII